MIKHISPVFSLALTLLFLDAVASDYRDAWSRPADTDFAWYMWTFQTISISLFSYLPRAHIHIKETIMADFTDLMFSSDRTLSSLLFSHNCIQNSKETFEPLFVSTQGFCCFSLPQTSINHASQLHCLFKHITLASIQQACTFSMLLAMQELLASFIPFWYHCGFLARTHCCLCSYSKLKELFSFLLLSWRLSQM